MEIVIRRSTVFAAASIVLGVVVALAASELVVRVVTTPTAADRIFIADGVTKRSVDCYPRAPNLSFPLDLARDKDRQELVSWLGKVTEVVAYSASRSTELERLEQRLKQGQDFEKAAAELATILPLCVTYDRQPDSSRFLVKSPGAKQTIALLGDSFVFGQGIEADATFSVQLARELKANVRSYALNGANMPEIEIEFAMALRDAARGGFSRIAYMYVLNDPYASPELSARLNAPSPPWLAALNSVSALSRRLSEAVARRTIGAETLRWYSDLHDPQINPGIQRTMARLATMTREARSRGVDFVVLVYPLMLDMASYPLSDVHLRLRELARQYGVELHDMLPAFEAKGRGASLVAHPLDYHPSAFAQGIAAQDAAAYLRGRSQ